MDVAQIKRQLSELDKIQQYNDPDSRAFITAAHEINEILYRDINIKDFTFIGQHLNRHMTIDDEAKLVIAAHENRPLTEAVGLSAGAAAAYTIRRGRRHKGLTQAELAEAVGITQSQMAKIENVSIGINIDVLQRIMSVLGETFVVKPTATV